MLPALRRFILTPRTRILGAGLALLGLGGALYWASGRLPQLECSQLQGWILGWGTWAPLYFILLYVAATVGLFPGVVLTLAAGMVFGVWWGTLLVLTGATAGAMLAFLLARYLLRSLIEQRLQRQAWFPKFAANLESKGFRYILFARLVPLFPFTGLNLASGVLPIRWDHYLLGSGLGMFPGTFAYVYLGESGCKLIDPLVRGDFRLSSIPPEVRNNALLAIVLFAIMTTGPLLWGHLSRKR